MFVTQFLSLHYHKLFLPRLTGCQELSAAACTRCSDCVLNICVLSIIVVRVYWQRAMRRGENVVVSNLYLYIMDINSHFPFVLPFPLFSLDIFFCCVGLQSIFTLRPCLLRIASFLSVCLGRFVLSLVVQLIVMTFETGFQWERLTGPNDHFQRRKYEKQDDKWEEKVQILEECKLQLKKHIGK